MTSTTPANHFVWGDITVGELIALSPSPADLAQSIWGAIHGLASVDKVRRQMIAAPFDLNGPLPNGRTLIEASAGTGKTYSIAALVTRFVAGDLAHSHDLAEGDGHRRGTRRHVHPRGGRRAA